MPKKSKPDMIGRCELTGETGTFIKSHIIPRSLARPRPDGLPTVQFGGRQRPTRRFDSWYDPRLVIQKGEDILTDYDTWGVAELKRLKLIWRSWGPMLSLTTDDFFNINDMHGVRRVVFTDAARMQRFLLSILWRSAATSLREFEQISLRPSDLRRLRAIVRDGSAVPESFLPITLTQISDRGEPHNLAPIAQVKESVEFEGYKSCRLPIFRFYFDGLIIHFHLNPPAEAIHGLAPMLVGPTEGTTLSTVTFEGSWQLLNIRNTLADAEHEFPGAMKRASGS